MSSSEDILIDIVIVTFRRIELLKALLKSIDLQGQSSLIKKIHIVINGSDLETHQYLTSLKREDIHLIHKPVAVSPAAARNTALRDSSGQWILFLDDDVLLPEEYFSRSLDFLRTTPEAVVFGGNDHPYPNCSKWELSLNFTLTSILATAHTRYRHRQSPHYQARESDLTLCNLWIKNSIFKEQGIFFNESFFRNEENILIDEIMKETSAVYRIPALFVYHRRRSEFLKAMKSVFHSGEYRIKSILLQKKLGNILHVIPMLALIFYVLIVVTKPISTSILMMLFYFVIVALMSFKIAKEHKHTGLTPHIFINHIGINLAYALGSMWGLISGGRARFK